MTFVDFVQLLATLNVTGVKRRHVAPPTRMDAADLPAMYPRIPTQATEVTTFGMEITRAATCELAVVVASDALDTKGVNFATACALVDNLNTALATLLDDGVDSWTIRQVYEQYGADGAAYVVLVATVEGSW